MINKCWLALASLGVPNESLQFGKGHHKQTIGWTAWVVYISIRKRMNNIANHQDTRIPTIRDTDRHQYTLEEARWKQEYYFYYFSRKYFLISDCLASRRLYRHRNKVSFRFFRPVGTKSENWCLQIRPVYKRVSISRRGHLFHVRDFDGTATVNEDRGGRSTFVACFLHDTCERHPILLNTQWFAHYVASCNRKHLGKWVRKAARSMRWNREDLFVGTCHNPSTLAFPFSMVRCPSKLLLTQLDDATLCFLHLWRLPYIRS